MMITAEDVIRAGACADGVHSWCDEHIGDRRAVTSDEALAVAGAERVRILYAAGLDGDGCGYGYGRSYGYGDGDGYGDGYGRGYGNGGYNEQH